MRAIIRQTQFKTDLTRIARSGRYQVAELLTVVEALAKERPRPSKHRDHPLAGPWPPYREGHIRPDWWLLYKLEPGRVMVVRTGSHSDLFEATLTGIELAEGPALRTRVVSAA